MSDSAKLAATNGSGELRRLRLDIAYDGTDFAGWARQPGQRTVQGVIENMLAMVLQTPTRLTVAGRTDSGVHATGQVAHFDISDAAFEKYADALLRKFSLLLPKDVRVTRVSVVPSDFDARFSALYRRYIYRISDAPWGVAPLDRYNTLPWRWRLDRDSLALASHKLLGEHDFAAFCRPREGATTIRRLERFEWDRHGDLCIATIQADAFCHSMVRGLIGALLAVGDGRRPIDWPAELLAARQRSSAITVAPANGLTLVHVEYPTDDQLAARALTTRRIRSCLAD